MIHSKLNIIQLRIILICDLFFYYVVYTLAKKHFDIDFLYHRQGSEQKQVAVHQI
jgi:hypothetical protein